MLALTLGATPNEAGWLMQYPRQALDCMQGTQVVCSGCVKKCDFQIDIGESYRLTRKSFFVPVVQCVRSTSVASQVATQLQNEHVQIFIVEYEYVLIADAPANHVASPLEIRMPIVCSFVDTDDHPDVCM